MCRGLVKIIYELPSEQYGMCMLGYVFTLL